MKSWLSVVLILTLVLLAPAAVLADGDAAKGKALFSSKCATCHGPAGEGRESIAKMLKVEMHPLSSKEVQVKKDAELKKEIAQGTGKMKPVKLTDEEAAYVLAFLRSLGKK
jgi:mono/diheme cytochrome c family protein